MSGRPAIYRRHAALVLGLCVSAAAGNAFANEGIDEVSTLLEAWQLEDAIALGQKIFVDDPNNPEVWLMAARILHQRGEHLAALELLDAAAGAGADVPQQLRAWVSSSATYQTSFQTLETAHFRIRYIDKDEIVATYAGPILESAYRNIGADLEFLPAERGEKIVVEIYPDARGLAGATGLSIKEIETSGTIAVCKFHRLMITSPLATATGYDWGDTLAHEYTHLVISKKSHNTIPIWLHEGIAKFYESRWKGKAGEALTPYSEKLLANATRKNDFITYAQMHPSMALLPSQEAAALAFAEVFTTIEFLRDRFGPKTIPRVLSESAGGKSLDKVLRDVFGLSLGGVESAWHRWIKKRKFREVPGAVPEPIRLATNEKGAKEEKPLEEIEDKQVHDWARLGELLQLRGRQSAAIVEYEKAHQRSGLRYATLINRLARALAAVNRQADALSLIDQLLRVNPDESDAHLLAGRIRLSKNDLDAAQKHFEAVRLRNPFNPEIYLALAHIAEAKSNPKALEQARHFLQLCSKPRPAHTYELPSRPAGEAFVSVVTPAWGHVRVNGGEPLPVPAWNIPVKAGEVSVEVLGGGTSEPLYSFNVAKGDSIMRVLR